MSDWRFDAFGRQRVSSTGQRLDGEFIYGKQDDFFDDTTTQGVTTWNSSTRDITLSLSDAANGSFAKIGSYPVPYTPGNSQLVELTGVLDLAGIGGGTLEAFKRSSTSGSAVEVVVPSTEWASRGTIDVSKAHIFVIDFQSLKGGSVRFGLNSHGTFHTLCKMDHDDSSGSGYWQLANGAAYWKLYTAGGTTYMELGYGDESNAVGFRYKIAANASATMRAICCTVKSEGGESLYNMPGLPRAISRQQSAATVSTTLIPILSIRPKTTYNSMDNLILGIPKSWQIQTDQPVRIVLLHDATLTGASWTDVDSTNSMMEYDLTASAVSGGHEVDEVYVATAGVGNNSVGSKSGPLGKTLLWDRQDSVTGILTIAGIRTGASDAAVLAAMRWEELR